MEEMKEAIKTDELTKRFGDFQAVDSVSFAVKRREIFGFLGPNGAGKTTTIKMLSTLLRPTSGSAIVNGFDVAKNADAVRNSIGIVFQNPALDDDLTGRENLDFHARMYRLDKKNRNERIKEVLELVNLTEWGNVLVKKYSGGMRRRLEIARGLMHSPKVLFLDEPTLGLDTQTRRAIWDYIKKLNHEEDITIFLTTHYMEEADYLCDRVAIMDNGKIMVLDTPASLKTSIGRDLIMIEVASGNSTEKFMHCMQREKWIKKVKKHDHVITLGVEKGEEKIPKITSIADKCRVKIRSISLRKPTLEDVFLNYTGSTLRDKEIDAGESFKRRVISMRGRR
jgi:ABC-2 type transport system ATP-binding protein